MAALADFVCKCSSKTFNAFQYKSGTRPLSIILGYVYYKQHPRHWFILIKKINKYINDARTSIPFGIPKGAMCVQRFDDSQNSAIHITYRISLRSSSMPEPRDPLLKVVFYFIFKNFIFLKNQTVVWNNSEFEGFLLAVEKKDLIFFSSNLPK